MQHEAAPLSLTTRTVIAVLCLGLTLGIAACANTTGAVKVRNTLPVPTDPAIAIEIGHHESTRYRIDHGLLGTVGQIDIRIEANRQGWTATGTGTGAILGLGKRVQDIETHLDARTLIPTRWQVHRKSSSRELTDFAQQPSPGNVRIVRKRPGRQDEGTHFGDTQPVFDPLGFLIYMRAARLPKDPVTLSLLDGQAYWQITLTPQKGESLRVGTQTHHTAKWTAMAIPLDWQRRPSQERSPKRFSLWITDDAYRMPVRVEAESPLGNVRVDLVETIRGPVAAPTLALHPH
ncbi:MAG: DUF3108 domain-containing protein [Deltaproteobacteria bacterium]|nr:DUF3108 domain-containing protein [Deltaproteobacteria bacterium]